MSEDGAKLAVVVAPDTSDEAARLFSALLSAGFHPVIDYGQPGATPPLANVPILAPLAELKEAQGFVRGLRAAAKSPAQTQTQGPAKSIFYSGSDRPVGPLPPENSMGAIVKALGVLLVLLAGAGCITLVVLAVQYVGALLFHGGR